MPLVLDLESHLMRAHDATTTPHRGFSVRRLASSPVDVRVFFADRGVLQSEPVQRWFARVSDDPLVERIERQGAGVTIRLCDEYVAELAAWLAAHDPREPLRTELTSSRTYAVNFLNPNATKPLHVGHLRNTTIGGALAASLRAGGAAVTTQCYICDIGRNVCEAIAGWERFHRDESPASVGLPSDQFVGRCYADYVRSLGDARPGGPGGPGGPDGSGGSGGDPIASETELAGDRADELVRAWMDGDAAVRAAWARIRDWALDGQRATLARLGVRFDRVFLESASFEAVRRVVDAGLTAGWLVREANGAVLYPAARKEYASLALVRPDGFPTEHARVLGLFLDEARESSSLHEWIVVCGDEWSTAGDVALEIARRMDAGGMCDKVRVVAHGMVTLQGSKMKSRDGKALLIDEFLERLANAERVGELVRATGAALDAPALVEILVKGYFLCRNTAKSIEFDWDDFQDETHNPAWSLALALATAESRVRADMHAGTRVHAEVSDEARVRAELNDGVRARAESNDASRPRGKDDADALRIAVMQYHQYREILRGSTEEFPPTAMIKFAIGVAKWYLARPADPRLDRVVRTLLAACATSVGIGVQLEPLTPRA